MAKHSKFSFSLTSRIGNTEAAAATHQPHATLLESRVNNPPQTIIEPFDRRKDIPGWTTVYTPIDFTPSTSAKTGESAVPEYTKTPDAVPASVSKTEDALPDLHPVVIYLVLFLATLVVNIAIFLYVSNFDIQATSLEGLSRKVTNLFNRTWLKISLLYRDLLFKIEHRTLRTQRRYIRFHSEIMDEHEGREQGTSSLHSDGHELEDFRTRDNPTTQENTNEASSGEHARFKPRPPRPHHGPTSPLSTRSHESDSIDSRGEGSSSGFEIARVCASPSVFRSPRSSTETHDFATEPARPSGNHPGSLLDVPRNPSSFPRSAAPSPSSYSPTPSAIAAANAEPGSAASALAPLTSNPPRGAFTPHDSRARTSPREIRLAPADDTSSDLSSGRFREQVARTAHSAPASQLPPSPPAQYMRFAKHRRQPTEEEWIEQRKQFEEEQRAEAEGRVVASVEREIGGQSGGRYPMASDEEAAYWDVEARGSGRGAMEGSDKRGGMEKSPGSEEGERLPLMAYQGESRESGTKFHSVVPPEDEHGTEPEGNRGVLGGVERAVDQMAGGLARWFGGDNAKSGGSNDGDE
ncbi:MAG: hypothetical protein M1821_005780 [Bathelium mastoideum]|nr:MAG: hypothetical protein M1821_005780 [Bathelium mastoideum]